MCTRATFTSDARLHPSAPYREPDLVSGSRICGHSTPMLRFTTAGESHGPALISVLEGMPAGLPLLAEHVNAELARRQQGYGRGRRMQIERDAVEFLSGVRAGQTLGSPVAMLIANRDWKNWQDVMDPAPRASDPDPRRRAVTR